MGENQGSDRGKLRRELVFLRKGQGLTYSRLEGMPTLRDALAKFAGLSTIQLKDAYLLLEREIKALGDGNIGRAVANAYAIGMADPRNITTRRIEFARKVGFSVDAVKNWEGRGIDELVSRLLHDKDTEADNVGPAYVAIENRSVGLVDGWALDSYTVVLRMEGPTPEAIETRRIRATKHGLDQVYIFARVLRHDSDTSHLDPRAIITANYGCRLGEVERISNAYFRQYIILPRALAEGEVHEFGVTVKIPEGRLMVPRRVFIPQIEAKSFDLTIHFGKDYEPEFVWRLNEVPDLMVDDWRPDNEIIELDAVGEVSVSFSGLKPGLVYGAAWAYKNYYSEE
jgi:hypothetical protein